MTERFTIKPQDDYFGITDNNTADKVNVINGIHTEIEAEWLCDLLNELNDEKERYKIISEIRQENINNRILTIKEFINNCSDKKVKETLKQLFYSEVKEYDLSKKNRKLEKENEQLRFDFKEMKGLLHSLEDEIKKLEKENKEFKEKLDDILELTELHGMIHLRKVEIKSIINR